MPAICRNAQTQQNYLFRDVGTVFNGLELSCTWEQQIIADRASAFQSYFSVGPATFDSANDYIVCFDGSGGVSNNMAVGAEGNDAYSAVLPVVAVWKSMGFRLRAGGGTVTHEFYYDLGAGTTSTQQTTGTTMAFTTDARLIFSNVFWAADDEGCAALYRNCKLWTRLLTVADLQTEATGGREIVTSATSLWGQWPLETDASDISGNSRPLTAQGSVQFAEIAFVAIGTQGASSTSAANLTATYPAGYTARADDLAIVWITGRPTDTALVTAPASWTEHTQARVLAEVGASDLRGQAFYRVLASGNAAPVFVVPTTWAGTTGGMATQLGIFRNVNPTDIFDVNAVVSTTAAAASFTPTGLTTVSSMAQVISVAISADDNALNSTTVQGFQNWATGTAYDTVIGGDHAFGMSSRQVATASNVTMPTWTQTVNGNDVWAAITMALKPVVQSTAAAAEQVPYQPWQARGPVLAQ